MAVPETELIALRDAHLERTTTHDGIRIKNICFARECEIVESILAHLPKREPDHVAVLKKMLEDIANSAMFSVPVTP